MHGLLITRMRLQPFVVTLCGLLIYRGVARFYTADATAGFAFGQNFPTLEWLTTGRTLRRPAQPRSPSSSSPLVMGVVLHRSVFGRYLYAVGKNEEAARYSGIRTDRVIVAAYVICCGLTALSAIFFAMYTRSISPASHGNFYELYAIAAAVLGGCSLRGGEGSIIGVVLGTILLQVLQNLVNLLGIPSSLNFAVMGGGDPDRRARRPAAGPLPPRPRQREGGARPARRRSRARRRVGAACGRPSRDMTASAAEHAPTVTVLLPISGPAPHLAEAVDSILNQTFRAFELLLIDDGADEKAEKLIRKIQRSAHPRRAA